MKIECPNCGEETIPCSCVEKYRKQQEYYKIDMHIQELLDSIGTETVELPEGIETAEEFVEWVRSFDNESQSQY